MYVHVMLLIFILPRRLEAMIKNGCVISNDTNRHKILKKYNVHSFDVVSS